MNDYIETTDKAKLTPFSAWNKINRAVHFDKDDPKILRNGKEVDLQEFINEANKDCTIYDVMKTYRGDLKLTAAQLNTMHHKVADELMEIKNLGSALEVINQAEKAWKELPLDVRKEFGHNVAEFQKNGLKWAQNKIKTYEAEQKAKMEAMNAMKVNNTEVSNNE